MCTLDNWPLFHNLIMLQKSAASMISSINNEFELICYKRTCLEFPKKKFRDFPNDIAECDVECWYLRRAWVWLRRRLQRGCFLFLGSGSKFSKRTRAIRGAGAILRKVSLRRLLIQQSSIVCDSVTDGR